MTATAVLHVQRAGPLVTIQDAGRPGLMRFGVPRSGPMDRFGHAAANVVLGRPAESTTVEVSLGGLALLCTSGSVTVAVCGGGFNVRHNGEARSAWTVCPLHPGDTFRVEAGPSGSWCYLAFAGDLVANRWLNSTSTHGRAGLGGGPIQTGSDLVIENAIIDDARDGPVSPVVPEVSPVRVVLGPQLECFRPEAVTTLLNHPFILTTAYDRMGVRLQGPELALDNALAIPSSPIVRGSLQVAGDGVPTLLFADHQTTGGYPKVATVIAADVDRAAQLRAGDTIRFEAIDAGAAVAAARASATQRMLRLDALAARPGIRTRQLLETNLIDGVFHLDTLAEDEPQKWNRKNGTAKMEPQK
jgi:biotin-dependent carboxylase-like uncharacterized protein